MGTGAALPGEEHEREQGARDDGRGGEPRTRRRPQRDTHIRALGQAAEAPADVRRALEEALENLPGLPSADGVPRP